MASSLRLAVSNIAWMPEQDDAIAELLVAEGVGGVEIAPTKWRERPLNATALDVAAYRRAWEDRGLRIVSMQSLLFGRPDLQLFANETQREAMVDYLRRTIDLGAALGARALVFGSPKNRIRGSLSERETTSIAIDTFHELGAHAAERGVLFCLEANPPEYGCDFITSTADAVALCRAVDHPGFRVNADLGGMTLSHDDPGLCISEAAGAIGHFHASEPHLSELGAAADHPRAAEGLATIHYPGWVSIEMRNVVPFASDANVEAVGRAVRLAKSIYEAVVA
ncbi:MAG: sugar phosphate isomerase/epimerase family protein [Gemmatimonadaceae bacterium]